MPSVHRKLNTILVTASSIVERNNHKLDSKFVIRQENEENSIKLTYCIDAMNTESIKVTYQEVDGINVWVVVTRYEQPVITITETQVSTYGAYHNLADATQAFRIHSECMYDAFVEASKIGRINYLAAV